MRFSRQIVKNNLPEMHMKAPSKLALNYCALRK